MMVPRRLAVVGVAVALLSLCGCGSQDNGVASKTPAEMLAATVSAAQSASSVYVQLSSDSGPLASALNMRYTREGAQGRFSLLGLRFELVRVGDTLYVSGNKAFYRQLGQVLGGSTGVTVAKLPAGTWLKGSATSGPFAQLGAITDMDSELTVILGRRTPVAKGDQATVAGQPAIELKQAAKLYTGTLFIATTGKPYPLLQRKTGREHGQTTFTDWNQPLTLTPPANAADISQLERGGR